jgi:hypothetical protein
MSGDEVDLLSILEVEFLLEILTIFGLAFRSCVARHLCLQNFSRPSTKYMFFVGDSRPSPVRVSNKQNIYKS